jgi:dephospho-CoA kinase
MITLACERGIRLERIMARGGWSREDVEARLDRQEGIEKHFYKADAVVDTGRDLSTVLRDVDALVATALDTESP